MFQQKIRPSWSGGMTTKAILFIENPINPQLESEFHNPSNHLGPPSWWIDKTNA
jgi:hypothetical protein